MVATVKNGDRVKVHYTGKYEDGTVFDSSLNRDPLDVEIGSAQVIEGFEDALVGMKKGEKKTIAIPPEKGYGDYNPSLLIEIPDSDIPGDFAPEVGMKLRMRDNKGQAFIVVVTEIGEDSIKLDANHPLAGKVLVFDLELVSIA